MRVSRAAALLSFGSIVVTAGYGMLFNGVFAGDRRLPAWAVAVSLVISAVVWLAVLGQVKRAAAASLPSEIPVDHNDLVLIVMGLTTATQAVAVGAELVLGAQAVWLVPSIGAVVFGALVVWLSRRTATRPDRRPDSQAVMPLTTGSPVSS